MICGAAAAVGVGVTRGSCVVVAVEIGGWLAAAGRGVENKKVGGVVETGLVHAALVSMTAMKQVR